MSAAVAVDDDRCLLCSREFPQCRCDLPPLPPGELRTLIRTDHQKRYLRKLGWAWVDSEALFAERVHPRLRRAAAEYDPSRNLLVVGPTGAGKSSAAARAVRDLIRKRGTACKVAWFVAAELARARREWPLGRGAPPAFEAAVSASVLVIDDLGFEPGDPAAWHEVFDERYKRGAPVIVTTGAPIAQLEERYGAATLRRLVEPHGTLVEVG